MEGKKKSSVVGLLESWVEREKESLVMERKWSLVEGRRSANGHHLQWEEFNHQKPQLKKRV